MATRQESVRLELVDQFSTPMARAAAATALLNAQLDRLNGSGVASRNTSTSQTIVRNTDSISRSSDQAGASIDRLSGRLSILAQAASVIGPAAIPIGALAVPAVTGLANSLAAAGLAGGSLILALQGVGDAVKAVDEYRLDPTAASLEKARTALEGLGPEAQQFVGAFQDFQPVLASLRDSAAEGWMPGLTEALDNIARVAPRVESLLTAISEAGGSVIADATDSLAGERWAEFLEFLAVEMPSTLLDLASTVGSLTHGLTELWMAFDPLNDDFSSWMVNSAADFDEWAAGLAQTEGFADFIDYVRENGPQVEATLAAFARATLDFFEAAAPLGGPVLEALELVAEAVSAIADSPIGPKLFTMAAAFVVLNKALSVTAGLMGRLGFTGAAGALRGALPGTAGAAAATGAASSGGFAGMVRGLTQITTAQDRARMSAAQMVEQQQRQAAAMAQLRRGLAVGAAGAVAFAVASGKLGDGMGFTNTAMLGLMGSLAGAPGAAAGGAIGLMLDLRDHTNGVADAQKQLSAVLRSSEATFGAVAQAQANLSAEQEKYKAGLTGSTSDLFGMLLKDPMEAWKLGFDSLDGQVDALNAIGSASKAATGDASQLASAFLQIGAALGDQRPITAGDIITPDVERIEGIIAQVQPAMQRLGITLADVAAMDPPELQTFINDMVELTRTADTPSGRLKTLNEIITNSGEVMLTATGRADALKAALDGLLSPQMGLTAATDNWTTSLRTLNDELAKRKTLEGDSNAAIQNRSAIQTRITDLSNLLVAEARAGAGPRRLSAILQRGRAELVRFGIEADLSGKELRRFLNGQGLTGNLVAQVLQKVRVEAEKTRTKVNGAFESLPDVVQTDIRTNGIPKTKADIDSLVAKYKLTEEERQALVTLRDLASSKAAGIRAAINGITDKSVTISIDTVRTTTYRTFRSGAQSPEMSADGGSVPKDGGPYSDRFLYLLAPGEEIITNRNGEADRFRADRAAGRIPGYANGGTIPGLADGGTARRSRDVLMVGLGGAADGAERGLKALRRALEESTDALQRERSQRQELIGTVRSNFTSDPFAQSGSVWGAASDPNSMLAGDIASLRAFQSTIRSLKNRGLNGAALAEADTLAEAQTLAGMSRGELRRYEQLYNQRQRIATSVGGTFANAAGASSSDIRELQNEVKRLRRDIKQEEQKNRRNRDENTEKATDGQRAAARKAAQRRRRNRDT